MSYNIGGRITHNYQEYLRYQEQTEAERLRQTTKRLESEQQQLRTDLATERNQNARDIRGLARQQTSLEERQRQHEALAARLQERQQEYERRSERRTEELAREIGDVERRTGAEIAAVREDMTREIAGVRTEIQQGLREVRQEVADVQTRLSTRIGQVHAELTAEREERLAKEKRQSEGAAALTTWIAERAAQIRNADVLGLTVEKTHVEHDLARLRELLAGPDADAAFPVAHAALSNFETLYTESERRGGVLEGVAGHVESVASRVEALVKNELFQAVFSPESQQIDLAVKQLRDKVAEWRTRPRWHAFENDRFATVELANQLLAVIVELDASLQPLVQQLSVREDQMHQMGELVTRVIGPVESFESTYANPSDPKSPRLLRARTGNARLDVYIDLDGTYSVDAYGFSSSVSCAAVAERMSHALQDQMNVEQQRVDVANPQAASMVIDVAPQSWKARTNEIAQIARSVGAQVSGA